MGVKKTVGKNAAEVNEVYVIGFKNDRNRTFRAKPKAKKRSPFEEGGRVRKLKKKCSKCRLKKVKW